MIGKTVVTPSSQPCDESTEKKNEILTWQPIECLEPEEYAFESIVDKTFFANDETKRTDSLRTQIDLPKLSSNFDELDRLRCVSFDPINAVDSYHQQYSESQLLSLLSEGAAFCPTPQKVQGTAETAEENEPSLSTQTIEPNVSAEMQHPSAKSESRSSTSLVSMWKPLENFDEPLPPLDATDALSAPAQRHSMQNEECPKSSDPNTKKFSEDLDDMERRLSILGDGQKSTLQILTDEKAIKDPAHVIEEYNKRVAERAPEKTNKAALSSP
ncbi:hypothetical protein Ddc_09787 [Ditylenchus destructor]|nr:hypothetical protein Ddc_09787 [Ditylenchus destructor]